MYAFVFYDISLLRNDKGGEVRSYICAMYMCYVCFLISFCVIYEKYRWIRYMDIWLWFMSHAGGEHLSIYLL